MINPLLSPNAWIGALVGAAFAVMWAVFFHGPSQYEAGGLAKAAQLDAATKQAAQEISDNAERSRYLRRQCVDSGGVYNFADGKCER